MHHLNWRIECDTSEFVPTWREIVEEQFAARQIPMTKFEVQRHPRGGLGIKIEHECAEPCPWTREVLEHAGFDAAEALRRAWSQRAAPGPTGTQFVVFYSWQSTSQKTNRSLIGDALERAVRELLRDPSVVVEPVVDRDTADMPGSPDIAATIFSKIERASMFVADVSLVLGEDERKSPNPNVLVELGYAAHALGWDRIVLVTNTHFGPVEALPFDLRQRRVARYEMAHDDKPGSARTNLADQLERALRHGISLGQRTSGEPTLRQKVERLRAEVSKANGSSYAPVMVASTVRYPGVSREEFRQRVMHTLAHTTARIDPRAIPDAMKMHTGPCKGEILHLAEVDDEAITLEIPPHNARVRVPLERLLGQPWRHSHQLMGMMMDVAIVVPDDVFTQPIGLERE